MKQLDNTNAMCSTFVGTLMYLSPERVCGDDFSYPSDIWSLGLSLMYCAQQSLPVPSDYWTLVTMFKHHDNQDNNGHQSPFALDPTKFSAEFCDFVRCCMYKDPVRRSTAAQLLHHPFLSVAPSHEPVSHLDMYTQSGDTSQQELEKLVDVVLTDRYRAGDGWKHDAQDVIRVRHLAKQLGCTEAMVGNAFRARVMQTQ